MFDRLVYFWLPALFVVFCGLVLLPRTSAPVIRFVSEMLHWF